MKRHLLNGAGEVLLLVLCAAAMLGVVLAPMARWEQYTWPPAAAVWIWNARRARREAEGWQVEAHWQKFWRHHEQAIPEGKPPIPGVVFPPDDH